MTRKTFLMCVMGFFILVTPISANTPLPKIGSKIFSKFVSKTGTKTISKVGTKTGAATVTNEARTISGERSLEYVSKTKRTKNTRLVTYDCNKCYGRGTVSIWNSYYGCYQSTTCPKCYGKGKITKVIRL